MRGHSANRRLLGAVLAGTLLLSGCGDFLRAGPDCRTQVGPPVTLEIAFDPVSPDNVAFVWSHEAAEMLDVTVTRRGGCPEVTVRIQPQAAR